MIEQKLKIEIGGFGTLIQFPDGHWCNPASVQSVVIREMPFSDGKYRPIVLAQTSAWEFPIECENMDEAKIMRDELAKYVCHGGKAARPLPQY